MKAAWCRIVGWLGTITDPVAHLAKTILKPATVIAGWISDWLEPRKLAFIAGKRAFVDVILYYRGAALPAVGLAFAFAMLDQTHEIYLQLAEDGARFGSLWAQPGGGLRIARLISGFAGLIALCFTLWLNARWTSLLGAHLWWQEGGGGALGHESPEYLTCRAWLKRWAPRVLGALPALGMAIGLFWTAFSEESGNGGVRAVLIGGAVLALTIGAVFLFVVIWRKRGSRDYAADRPVFQKMQYGGLALVIAFTVLVALIRVTPAQIIGPVAIFCLFGIGLSVTLTLLTENTHRSHIPWTSLLVGLALFWSIADWNDNHRLDMDLEGMPVAAPGVSFAKWLETRRGDDDGEFTVYIVAAQGGGLYAAYHTAFFLARAQDLNPEFANHLFAISGVSGGSVGAAVFHAILNSGICPREIGACHVEKVREVLRQDFLSPVAASLLFSDFTARFLPFPVPGLSRARAMEDGFAAALEAAGANPDAPLLGSWEPAGEKGPLLLFNTTDVNTGDRMVMTPLESIYGGSAGTGEGARLMPVETMAELLGCAAGAPGAALCRSPRLLSAALVSARFPVVTPAARMDFPDGTERRYVDGGYFENSAVETAEDLHAQIGRHKNVSFHLIAMDFPGQDGTGRDRPYWLGEIMSPVRAFLNARGARGELAKRRAERTSSWTEYRSASLDDQAAQFTLGWMLSTRTFDQIEFEIANDDVAGDIGRTCLGPEQRNNRDLLAEIAGLPGLPSELPDC
ncbi:MAG: patatin-like phospholipase family protein [Alphaproteobacteria bacterium]